ncbi:transcription initiation factor IID, TAF10 subunit [Parathielavia hyrcaniae]|uniref:Transcription initiation factor TFIID subunit 10 n=1 Tax=Parathielavia hyrcaniae TaxID=113614 RepID=A0AAN6Q1G0_9PEZI|nr:transcription initiation factor IID, TAF10 subunit [Parathielavia hyrcaniae]
MAANIPTDNAEQMAAPASTAATNGTQPTGEPSSSGMNAGAAGAAVLAAPEPRLPTRKDTSLKEFMNKMDDYAPIIPDAVTNYYMTRAGLPPPPQTDPRLARLLALATQKFIADIAADAYQYSRIRASNTSANNPMGNLGAAAGFPIPGQQAGGQPGAAGAGGGGGGKAGDQGGRGGAGAPLGIQRPGYGGGGQGGSQNRTVLTMEDLGMAVGEFGVNVKRSEFYR